MVLKIIAFLTTLISLLFLQDAFRWMGKYDHESETVEKEILIGLVFGFVSVLLWAVIRVNAHFQGGKARTAPTSIPAPAAAIAPTTGAARGSRMATPVDRPEGGGSSSDPAPPPPRPKCAVTTCPHCGRLNLDDELRAAGFICELCRQTMPRPIAPPPTKAQEASAPGGGVDPKQALTGHANQERICTICGSNLTSRETKVGLCRSCQKRAM
jgi:hypothetical protein